MAKIGKGHFRWEDQWGDYDIFYSSKDKEFFADASKLFSGSGEFFDSMIESNVISDDQKQLKLYKVNHGRSAGIRQISANTQKELEDAVSLFNRMFVQTTTSEKKIILYSFSYNTETQNNDSRGMRIRENLRQEFTMGFKYRIAIKKTMGSNNIYYDCEYNGHHKIDRYDLSNMKEIAWSQELEDFIKSFSKGFDGLIDKMKPFFETEGKIMELIGKNILTQ